MDGIRQYLFSVILAAIFSALTISVIGKKGMFAPAVKLLSGLFMTVIVITPLTKLQIADLSVYFDKLNTEASSVVQDGTDMAAETTASIIKENVEAYILDKASSMGVEITVDITLTETVPPTPNRVTLSGAVSPYAKQKLQKIISEDLGIPEEKQLWT